ncbi:MAG: potassium-transporting ATPase subunit F [Turneriella sp.]
METEVTIAAMVGGLLLLFLTYTVIRPERF